MSPDTRTGSAEFDLLCLLARPTPDLARAREALRQDIDVAELLRTAAEHSVRPQLIRSLAALSWEGVPATSRSALAAFQRHHLVCSLAAVRQLSRVASAFAARGVRFAAFKGATLAKALHGDLSAREYNDIDLIVPKAQLGDAEDVLASLGYRGGQGDRAFRDAFLAYMRQYAFVHPELAVTVDLHWDFSGSHVPFPLTPAEAFDELEDVSIGYQRVPAVSGTNLALLLAGHGTKEAWQSLAWVGDFALLIDRRPGLDWPAIHRRAQARGCGDSVLLGCAVAQRLLGVAVPPALARAVGESRRVGSIAAALVDDLRRNEPAQEKRKNLTDLDLCDARRGRIGAMLKLAFTRTVGDYQAMPLPPELWRVYHATRPFRVAAKAVASFRR